MNNTPAALFHGLPVRRLANDQIGIDVLSAAGPRIVRLFLAGTAQPPQPEHNLLAETPGFDWQTPNGMFRLHGGHRIWRAPEDEVLSAIPDDQPPTIEEIPSGLHIAGKIELQTGLQKTLQIQLEADRPMLRIKQSFINHGSAPVKLAVWGITQLPLDGMAVIPWRKHAGGEQGLLPDRSLALWPYARHADTRLRLTDDAILVHGQAGEPALKIGCFCAAGWAAYCHAGAALVKTFQANPRLTYPDLGCNVEVYVNNSFIELETLSSLNTLRQGESAHLEETWEILSNLPLDSEAAVQTLLTQRANA